MQTLKQLPHVGLVERFDESMAKFAELITPHFPKFKLINAHVNKTSDPKKTLKAKLSAFEEEIGRMPYLNLMQLNSIDLELYNFVVKSFEGGE